MCRKNEWVLVVSSARRAGVCMAIAGLVLVCNVLAQAATAPPIGYTSSFEESSIAPFWTLTADFGSVALSKDVAYGGTHAIKFQSSSGGNRGISLVHFLVFPRKERFRSPSTTMLLDRRHSMNN
jgi:hypothetical protein